MKRLSKPGSGRMVVGKVARPDLSAGSILVGRKKATLSEIQSLTVVKDPRVSKASADLNTERAERKQIVKNFLEGRLNGSSEKYKLTEIKNAPGGYSHEDEMDEKNRVIMNRGPDFGDMESSRVLDESLVEGPRWRSMMGLEATLPVSLRAEDGVCILENGRGDELGRFRPVRKDRSYCLHEIYCHSLWGHSDVPLEGLDLTPDHWETSPMGSKRVFEMKVGYLSEDMTKLREAVSEKYGQFASVCHVVRVSPAGVASTYTWETHASSIEGGRYFSFCVRESESLFRSFQDLFEGLGNDTDSDISHLRPMVISDRNIVPHNKHNHLLASDYEELKRRAVDCSDGLSSQDVANLPEDDDNQFEIAERTVLTMSKSTAARDFDPKRLKAKITGFPLFKPKPDAVRLHGIDDDVIPPNISVQKETDQAITVHVLDKILKDLEQEKTAAKWRTRDPKEMYDKSAGMTRNVDEKMISDLIKRLLALVGKSAEMSPEDILTERKKVYSELNDAINETFAEGWKTGRRTVESPWDDLHWVQDKTDLKAVRSSFVENSYLYHVRNKAREELRRDPDAHLQSQKNLAMFKDKAFKARIGRGLGVSQNRPSQADTLVGAFKQAENCRDGNYDYLRIMSICCQEIARAIGRSTGSGIMVKAVPDTRSWIMCRNSGRQAICCIVADEASHIFDEDAWWFDLGQGYVQSKYFTVNEDKLSFYLNADETYRALKCMLTEQVEKDGTGQSNTFIKKYCNLFTIILATQRQPDSVILNLARYIGMNQLNNSVSRGPVSEIFTKIERMKTRVSVFVVRRYLKWIKRREERQIMPVYEVDGKKRRTGKSIWKYDDWLTAIVITDQNLINTTFYTGNVYEKVDGERSASMRGVFEKLIALEIASIRGKLLPKGDPNRINEVLETLPSYDKHYQVDFALVVKVLTTEWARHTKNNPNWKTKFGVDLNNLNASLNGAKLATNRSSFNHKSDRILSGLVVRQISGGAQNSCFYKGANHNFTMKTAVAKWPGVLLGTPLTSWENLETSMRVAVVPKKQLGSKREILILTASSRVMILSMETVMRAIAEQLENEVLTDKNKEAKFVSYAGKVNHWVHKLTDKKPLHVRSRSSADATKWCQLFRMVTFMIMVRTIFADLPNVRDHCLAVLYLHTQKKIQIPEAVIREVLNGQNFYEPGIRQMAEDFNEDTELRDSGECFVKIIDNMLQGILHYTSSVYHSLVQNYFTERVRSELDEALMFFALNELETHEDNVELLKLVNSKTDSIEEVDRDMMNGTLMRAEGETRQKEIRKRVRAAKATLKSRSRVDNYEVPTWRLFYLNAASSDDTAILIDVVVTGRTAFKKIADNILTDMLSKYILAKRTYYKRMGMEESTSKSSTGDYQDRVEFNSKWYVSSTVNDVILKQVISATRLAKEPEMSKAMDHYFSSKSALLATGASVKLMAQVVIAQMRIHYRMLGSDMTRIFKHYAEDLAQHPHESLGFYEFELNPALAGSLPHFLNHFMWLRSEATRRAEMALTSKVAHEVEPTGLIRLRMRMEIGNGVRDRKSMENSELLFMKFADQVFHGRDPDEVMDEMAIQSLAGRPSVAVRLLTELDKDRRRPIGSESSPVSMSRLSTMLMTSPCVSVSVPRVDRNVRVSLRMSLPGVMALVKAATLEETSQEPLLLSLLEDAVPLVDSLMSLTVKEGPNAMPLGSKAVSSFKQDLFSLPTARRPQTVLYMVWSGATLTEDLKRDFLILQTHFTWLRSTVSETLQSTGQMFLSSRRELANYFNRDIALTFGIRSRSGLVGSTSAFDAIVTTLEGQYDLTRISEVEANSVSKNKAKDISSISYEAGLTSVMPRTELTRLVRSMDLSGQRDAILRAGSWEEKCMLFANTMLNDGLIPDMKQIMENMSKTRMITMYSGTRRVIRLQLGSAFCTLNLKRKDVVNSITTNLSGESMSRMLKKFGVARKTWLSWDHSERVSTGLYYSIESGHTLIRLPNSVPVYVSNGGVIPRYQTVTTRLTRNPGVGGRSIVTKLVGDDPKTDYMILNFPRVNSEPKDSQRKALMNFCLKRMLHFTILDEFCRGKMLTEEKLMESYKDTTRSIWRLKVQRTRKFLLNGKLQPSSWPEDWLSLRAGMSSEELMKNVNVFTSVWLVPKDHRADPEFLMLKEKRTAYWEAQQEPPVDDEFYIPPEESDEEGSEYDWDDDDTPFSMNFAAQEIERDSQYVDVLNDWESEEIGQVKIERAEIDRERIMVAAEFIKILNNDYTPSHANKDKFRYLHNAQEDDNVIM